MNNIKPKYYEAQKFGKEFIADIKRPNANTLTVRRERNKKVRLKSTDTNFALVAARMKEQNEYQVLNVLPLLHYDKLYDIAITFICLGMAAITQHMNLPIGEKFQKTLHCGFGFLTALGITLTVDDYAKINSIIKHQFFFENKDFINNNIEKSKNILNGTNILTRMIIKYGSEADAVNLMNLKYISLDDLKRIKDNILALEDLGFEHDDQIKRTRAIGKS